MEGFANVSRRNFLRAVAASGIAAGTLGLAGCAPQAGPTQSGAPAGKLADTGSWRTAPEPIAEDQITATKTADVVIIGGGIAGVSTAVSALENGLSVIVLEKNETPRMTGLDFGCVNPSLVKEAGLGITEEQQYQLVRDWVHMGGEPRASRHHLEVRAPQRRGR